MSRGFRCHWTNVYSCSQSPVRKAPKCTSRIQSVRLTVHGIMISQKPEM